MLCDGPGDSTCSNKPILMVSSFISGNVFAAYRGQLDFWGKVLAHAQLKLLIRAKRT